VTRIWRRLRWRVTDLRIAVALAAVASGVRLFGLRRVLRLVDGFVPVGPATLSRADAVKRGQRLAGRIAAVAARLPGQPRCLSRSLALRMALRRRGIANELCIGIRITREFAAHAWIEVDGVPAGELEDVRSVYARFPTFAGTLRSPEIVESRP
jgi:hypothetical protein